MSTIPAESEKVFIIFPCYNEEEGLEKLLQRVIGVQKVGSKTFRLVVVNDGSSDHTVQVARAVADDIPMHIIDFPKNRGVAAVFNTAFEYVLQNAQDNDIVITIDSDNTMNPYTILDMLAAIENSDVVIASRFVGRGRMVGAGYRAYLSYIASWLMRWRVAIPNVRDYSIFYRAYRLPVLRQVFERFQGMPVEGAGFSCMANLLIRVHDLNPLARFSEVPLVLRYDKKEGGSGIKMGRTIRGYLKLAFGRRARHLSDSIGVEKR